LTSDLAASPKVTLLQNRDGAEIASIDLAQPDSQAA
jgi:hypothetical protein